MTNGYHHQCANVIGIKCKKKFKGNFLIGKKAEISMQEGHHRLDQLKHILCRAFSNEARLEEPGNSFSFWNSFRVFSGKKSDKSFHEDSSEAVACIWPAGRFLVARTRVCQCAKSLKIICSRTFSHSFRPKDFTKWKNFNIFSNLLSLQAGRSFTLWFTL